MAKPTATTGWTGGTATEPSAGKKLLGWLANERPAAPYLQWLFERIEAWLSYLSDGALEGDHSIDGDLALTGELRHGDRVKTIGFANGVYTGSCTWDSGNNEAAASAAGSVTVVVPFEVGDRIKTATARAHGNGATIITVAVEVLDGSGGSVAQNNGGQALGAGYTTTAATTSVAATITAAKSVQVTVTFSGGGSAAQNVAIIYDHP